MMRRWMVVLGVGVVGIVAAGCSSSTSSTGTTTTTGATTTTSAADNAFAILPPATTKPAYKECTTQIVTAADGTATPLQCADGAINTTAWQHYATSAGSILGLGASATKQQVVSALCSATSSLSTPILQDAYRLAYVYYGWAYGSDLATTTLVTDPSTCG